MGTNSSHVWGATDALQRDLGIHLGVPARQPSITGARQAAAPHRLPLLSLSPSRGAALLPGHQTTTQIPEMLLMLTLVG